MKKQTLNEIQKMMPRTNDEHFHKREKFEDPNYSENPKLFVILIHNLQQQDLKKTKKK